MPFSPLCKRGAGGDLPSGLILEGDLDLPLSYSRNLKVPSRELRSGMTDAEQRIWFRLRRKQVLGIQFYRQKPIGPYIVDFYAPTAQLVIEVDGCQHLEPEHAMRDADRDAFLTERGLFVVRFNNLQALLQTEVVMEEIERICRERIRY
jgi:very-short-patch-repair endonuclease